MTEGEKMTKTPEEVKKALRIHFEESGEGCALCPYAADNEDGQPTCIHRICRDAMELIEGLEKRVAELKGAEGKERCADCLYFDAGYADGVDSACMMYGEARRDDDSCEEWRRRE